MKVIRNLVEKHAPAVKICGLTNPKNAEACAEAGADAIGFVFFEKSPRHLSISRASEISRVLPAYVGKVGVFVNASMDEIMERVERCRLTSVQLHGNETPELVERIMDRGIPVIKTLFSGRAPELSEHSSFHPAAYLAECGKGSLPGGNAKTWNWIEVTENKFREPLILAGGLSSENILQAVNDTSPHAVDLSSSVEFSPGVKDMAKVKRLLTLVKGSETVSFRKKPSFF